MAKKGKKNRRVKNRRRHQIRDPIREVAGLYVAPHPFNQIDRDVLRKALSEHGRKAAEDFVEGLRDLEALIHETYPAQVLAVLTTYGIVGTVNDAGDFKKYLDEKFNQSHIELAQAISLKSEWDDDSRAPTAEDIQKLFNALPAVADNFAAKRYVDIEGHGLSDEEKHVRALQEHLRLHTQVVRNWGYFSNVVKTLKALVDPLDGKCRTTLGFPLSGYLKFIEWLCEALQQRITERFRKISEIAKLGDRDAQIKRAIEVFPTLPELQADFEKYARQDGLPKEHFGVGIVSYADYTLTEEFLYSLDVAMPYFGDRDNTIKALKHISIAPGELAGANTEHFFLTNPIWTRPLVRLEEDVYFAVTPQSFFSFSFQILDGVTALDAGLRKAWEERRAEFLEDEIERVLKRAFPDAKLARGFKWKVGADTFENDLLVLVDSHLLIVEAKSGSVSWPALRGGPDRAKKHFQELITAPSVQSARLLDAVKSVLANPQSAAATLPDFPFDFSVIKALLRLSVTLEDFAVVQSNVQPAIDAGWVPAGHTLPPTILLADLEVVMDILATQAERIHYLKRRAEIQESMDYVADELDLLGTYLANGFDLEGAEAGGVHMALTGMSKPIDDYYQALHLHIEKEKPQRKLTKWWRAICDAFENRGFERWSEVAAILLDINLKNQKTLEHKFQQIKLNVRRNWEQPNHHCSITLVPPSPRQEATILYAFKNENAESRHDVMQQLPMRAFKDHQRIKKCIVVGVNIDNPGPPYSTVAVFERPREDKDSPMS